MYPPIAYLERPSRVWSPFLSFHKARQSRRSSRKVRMGIERVDGLKMRQASKTLQQLSGNQTKAARLLVVARQEGFYCVKKFLAGIDLWG